MTQKELFDNSPKISPRKLNVLPPNPEDGLGRAVVTNGRFPPWLHRKLSKGSGLWETGDVLSKNRLNTVCEEAKCPNRLECWSAKTATFLVMGKECTRNCGFCDIDFSKSPKPVEVDEPQRLVLSVKELGLKHVVITMVARDDLKDGGASHLVAIMREVKKECPDVTIEVLTSDFEGNFKAISSVLDEGPAIFNHNIETVRELTRRVRHKATYERTLSVLKFAKQYSSAHLIKSGLMVGLGETKEQVFETLKDLKMAGCDIVTIGQYLQANHRKLLIKSFITPEEFMLYETFGKEIGIKQMHCGPFVRSSYNAAQFVRIKGDD